MNCVGGGGREQNQKKLQAEVKNAEKADDEYKKSVEKLKNMESRFYDSEMPQILKVFMIFLRKNILITYEIRNKRLI
jgi:hypothetical protein